MRSLIYTLTLVALIGSLSACSKGVQAPPYTLARVQDVSIGAIKRIKVKVSVPQRYDRHQVSQIAQAVVSAVTATQKVNAIVIFFYGQHSSTSGFYDIARVVWAPNGNWSDAGSVPSGDYSVFSYSMSYKKSASFAKTNEAPSLVSSGQTGLLSAPLPKGAILINKTATKPASGRDPSERYKMSASAAQIMAFFKEAMVKAGWIDVGPDGATYAFYKKGNHLLSVLTDKDGGSFTLMGS